MPDEPLKEDIYSEKLRNRERDERREEAAAAKRFRLRGFKGKEKRVGPKWSAQTPDRLTREAARQGYANKARVRAGTGGRSRLYRRFMRADEGAVKSRQPAGPLKLQPLVARFKRTGELPAGDPDMGQVDTTGVSARDVRRFSAALRARAAVADRAAQGASRQGDAARKSLGGGDAGHEGRVRRGVRTCHTKGTRACARAPAAGSPGPAADNPVTADTQTIEFLRSGGELNPGPCRYAGCVVPCEFELEKKRKRNSKAKYVGTCRLCGARLTDVTQGYGLHPGVYSAAPVPDDEPAAAADAVAAGLQPGPAEPDEVPIPEPPAMPTVETRPRYVPVEDGFFNVYMPPFSRIPVRVEAEPFGLAINRNARRINDGNFFLRARVGGSNWSWPHFDPPNDSRPPRPPPPPRALTGPENDARNKVLRGYVVSESQGRHVHIYMGLLSLWQRALQFLHLVRPTCCRVAVQVQEYGVDDRCCSDRNVKPICEAMEYAAIRVSVPLCWGPAKCLDALFLTLLLVAVGLLAHFYPGPAASAVLPLVMMSVLAIRLYVVRGIRAFMPEWVWETKPHVDEIVYVPHMLTTALSEYQAGVGPVEAQPSMRLKCLRQACLPLRDHTALELRQNTEMVGLSLLPLGGFTGAVALGVPARWSH